MSGASVSLCCSIWYVTARSNPPLTVTDAPGTVVGFRSRRSASARKESVTSLTVSPSPRAASFAAATRAASGNRSFMPWFQVFSIFAHTLSGSTLPSSTIRSVLRGNSEV